MTWEETFGVELKDEEAARLTTPRHAIDLICSKLRAIDEGALCPTLRAYHRVRRGLRAATGDPLLRPPLHQPVSQLYRHRDKTAFWRRFRSASGVPGFKPPVILFASTQCRDLVDTLLSRHVHALRNPGEPWTRPWVRQGVRAAVTHVSGVRQFSDDDRFVQDIGID
ncbi:MAG: hypothetical protein KDK99_01275 [Verrucomicrobiales bacterium]|nr:hypothetical protein [Verrucomicrobiales bacterium]